MEGLHVALCLTQFGQAELAVLNLPPDCFEHGKCIRHVLWLIASVGKVFCQFLQRLCQFNDFALVHVAQVEVGLGVMKSVH